MSSVGGNAARTSDEAHGDTSGSRGSEPSKYQRNLAGCDIATPSARPIGIESPLPMRAALLQIIAIAPGHGSPSFWNHATASADSVPPAEHPYMPMLAGE